MDLFAHDTCAATCVSRRRVICAGAAGAAAVALAGCSTYGDEQSPAPADDATGGASGASVSNALAKVADVPVGGGLIVAGQKVVLAQPEAGTIKAFSATCTHQGCTVGAVENGKITCPCHGSAFNIADGSVANGPASQPLPAIGVAVQGDQITRA